MVDGDAVIRWPKDEIPDDCILYLRVNKANRDRGGDLIPRAFLPQPIGADGLSTNWGKYAGAIASRFEVRNILHPKTGERRALARASVANR